MIGIWDYTVILTYGSLLSAVMGILVSLSGHGHPYFGVLFLLLCGLFDTFDGRVARSKKNRTKKEKDFGVQIDSLSDLVAFGVLPVCIGMGLGKEICLTQAEWLVQQWLSNLVFYAQYLKQLSLL